ncbi:aspartyl-tRNA synthetase [Coniochaeta ligniaria NRRL 30616]|uniref:Probable aspartate--tRNA ligase, cytoplasmic n=1 Tax=Coniochaeta ligniaria NRRL 30616 TaxID=1408157 RepID=A0A1J7IMU8_9PEZI|nr:aspartyl-tRNA synthetase [Coniochaeta ligniaria NRRL 30616]
MEREKAELEARRKSEEERARALEDPEILARYGGIDEPVHPMELISIEKAATLPVGAEVTFRCRIQHQRRISEALDFLLLRDKTHTIQGVLSRGSPHMIKWVQRLHSESLVEVHGTLQKPLAPVKSALHSDIEVNIFSIHLVSAANNLPWDNYHAPEALYQRMQDRILDLRHPSNQALFRIRATITRTFRQALEEKQFVEIQTPKLQPAATESGAEVFKVNYFGRRAFLAQSPQLAKQMSISADFGKVFEIGPVFRAENSNTHRHLTEYTGLDIEMALTSTYRELIHTIDGVLKRIFAAMYAMPEVEIVRQRWPSAPMVWLEETPILTYKEGIAMLREDGREAEEEEDLSTRDEMRLGELVKEKYKTDYYILDKFPATVRPFYTHPDEDPRWTNSFDIFVKGQEICTGGQRIHDPKDLRRSMKKAGIAEDGMEEYLMAFDHGAPPHGGAGLGLERILTWALELGDVRYATLYPRDPKSLPEKPPSLPHPEADTTKPRLKDQPMPPVEDLIANYGDASNTSWLDDRFQIWRHHTGAAIGYLVRSEKFVMMTGDPLCDPRQYQEVISAFLEFVKTELKRTPIWMLVSAPVQAILGADHGYRTLTCAEEQRVDADRHALPKGAAQDQRRVEREGIKIHEVKPDDKFRERADKAIEAWKAARTSRHKQIHLTEIRPWVDQAHRRYFVAEKGEQVCAMVVLARLAPRHGWQVKWALDFPDSPSGTIEVLIDRALSAISGPVTFGVGASEKLKPGAHLHGVRAKFLARSYDVVAKSLKLGRKSEFRQKFGAYGEAMYICYPRWGVTVRDLQEIIKFFED